MLNLHNLTEEVRRKMLEVIEADGSGLYLSPRLTEDGKKAYPALLREAVEKAQRRLVGGTTQPSGANSR
ncbi:hypothetical protein [Frigoriglobus tundricola]|uniref:Uncharacterized protein n=1 Tax=Frigoriglobus tundricola TaxID=2774151 RepID=A0A6M5Z3T3_9BACT|nr:hypothetical protein [Frigoriglobus tundricola]QJX01080.1 hypothetical protein FTUN_8719 [Frigoriglobus tundricola]